MVDALVEAVRADYPRLAHRYYLLKAKWLGLPEAAALGPQRPAAGRRRPPDRLAGGAQARAWGLRRLLARSSPRSAALLRPALDRRRPAPRQGGRRLRPSHRALGASLPAAELSRPHARRDDAGARARPRRAPGAGRRAGLPDGRHAADAGRNRQRVRRDADVPRAARRRDRRAARAAHHAGRQGRGHAEHGGAADRLLPVRDPAARRARARASWWPERIGEIWLQVQTESLGPAFEFTAGIPQCSGPMCRISSTRRSTSTPMRSATAW